MDVRIEAFVDLFHLYAVKEAFDDHFYMYAEKLVISVSAQYFPALSIYNLQVNQIQDLTGRV